MKALQINSVSSSVSILKNKALPTHYECCIMAEKLVDVYKNGRQKKKLQKQLI